MDSSTKPDDDDADPLRGSLLGGRYRIERRLGRGGMGSVYAARDVELDEDCAVKLLSGFDRHDAELGRRLAREAAAVRAIDSAYVVRHRDSGVDAAARYLVMDLVSGEDLGSRLARDGRLAVAEVLSIAADVLRGLRAAHTAGVVHRDLKPENVMLVSAPNDGEVRAKIVDFGVSKLRKPMTVTMGLALTRDGTAIGTPFYMSPEQAQALEIDERADLYSLGAMLFECLSGRPPHVGESYEQVIVAICTKDAVDVRSIVAAIPKDVAAFVARALERDRDRRFASASHMLRALLAIAPEERRIEDDTLATSPISEPPTPPSDSAAERGEPRPGVSVTENAPRRLGSANTRGVSVYVLAGGATVLGALVAAAAIGIFGESQRARTDAVVVGIPSGPSSSPGTAPPALTASSPPVPDGRENDSGASIGTDAGRLALPPPSSTTVGNLQLPVPPSQRDSGVPDIELLRELP